MAIDNMMSLTLSADELKKLDDALTAIEEVLFLLAEVVVTSLGTTFWWVGSSFLVDMYHFVRFQEVA